METYEYLVIISTIILTVILLGMAGVALIHEMDLDLKPYTIQDVYVYCCNHPEVEITNAGDNCTNVINNIYGGRC